MHARLHRLFEHALKLSIASCPLLTGCGTDAKSPECDASSLKVSSLSPAVPVDSLELRWSFTGSEGPFPVSSATGTPCSTASDVDACLARYQSLTSRNGFASRCELGCSHHYLVYTRGDEATIVDTAPGLQLFLGELDVPQDAAFLAWSAGLNLACDDLDRGAIRRTGAGWEVIGARGIACGADTAERQYRITFASDGTKLSDDELRVLKYGEAGCAIGRRPGGLCEVRHHASRSALGRHFAVAAHLEWASVTAFEQLERELATHGAPWSLRLAARAAAFDERRHTITTTRLARRFGAAVRRPSVRTRAAPSLFTIARENAVEGCVRETFGALVAHRQAAKATDPEIARELQQIAVDETRHAALSWQLDGWAQRQLSRRERQALRSERRQAVGTLRREAATRVDPSLVDAAGLPDGDEAVALVDQLDAGLFSEHG